MDGQYRKPLDHQILSVSVRALVRLVGNEEKDFGNCKLCGEPSRLQISHIVPEFLFRPMYDEQHRFHVLDTQTDLRTWRMQKGIKERMLCAECEQRLSKYEHYTAAMLRGNTTIRAQSSNTHVFISGIDYRLLKLCLLSILWRASVTKQEFFKLVKLGPHEEKVRKMIVEERPGTAAEYGCIVAFTTLDGESLADTMFNPEPMRWAGRRFYKFYFASAVWTFYCDSRPAPEHLRRRFLQENGTLRGSRGDLREAKSDLKLAQAFAKRMGYL